MYHQSIKRQQSWFERQQNNESDQFHDSFFVSFDCKGHMYELRFLLGQSGTKQSILRVCAARFQYTYFL